MKVQLRMCSWFCRGIPLGSWRSGGFPYQIRYHRRGSGSAGIPGDSHSSQPPFWQHREQSRRVQRPLCSDPWPSCFRLRSVRTRSCLDGRSVRMVRILLSPWFQARDQQGWPWGHICLLKYTKYTILTKCHLKCKFSRQQPDYRYILFFLKYSFLFQAKSIFRET